MWLSIIFKVSEIEIHIIWIKINLTTQINFLRNLKVWKVKKNQIVKGKKQKYVMLLQKRWSSRKFGINNHLVLHHGFFMLGNLLIYIPEFFQLIFTKLCHYPVTDCIYYYYWAPYSPGFLLSSVIRTERRKGDLRIYSAWSPQ